MSDPDRAPDENAEAYAIYCLLSGEFFHAYTAVEHELNCPIYAAITRFSKRRTHHLLAVLGGQRMSAAQETVKRLLRATRASEKRLAFADGLFLQLSEIQFLRNRLAHSLTVISEADPAIWVNMNFAGIRELHQMEDVSFHLDTLRCATSDLATARLLIGGIMNHHTRRGSAKTPPLPSWLYKPAMLTRENPISLKNPQSQKRQPLSPQEKAKLAKLARKARQRSDPSNRKKGGAPS